MKTGDKCYSSCGEIFQDFEPDYNVGDQYFSGILQEVKPSDLVSEYTIQNILEQMEEDLYNEVGEIAEGNLFMEKVKQEKLLFIIKGYLDENVGISCYKVIEVDEHVMMVG